MFGEKRNSGNVPVSSLLPIISVSKLVNLDHVSGIEPLRACLDKTIRLRLERRAISKGSVPAMLFPVIPIGATNKTKHSEVRLREMIS